MSNSRLLLDTVFIQALLNPRDQYHDQAKNACAAIAAPYGYFNLSS